MPFGDVTIVRKNSERKKKAWVLGWSKPKRPNLGFRLLTLISLQNYGKPFVK